MFDFCPPFLIRHDLHGNLWLIKHFPPPSPQNEWDGITVYFSTKYAPKCKISRESLLAICKVIELIQSGILPQNEVLFFIKPRPVPHGGTAIHTIPICSGGWQAQQWSCGGTALRDTGGDTHFPRCSLSAWLSVCLSQEQAHKQILGTTWYGA